MSRPNINLKTRILVLSLIVLAVTVGISLQFFNHVLSTDLNFPKYDAKLSPKVSAYLAEHAPRTMKSDNYDSNGNLLSGQADNYCDAMIHGYDQEYIYAFVSCQEYGWFYHYNRSMNAANTIEITRSLQEGTSWSSHVRLKYKLGTDFEIVNYDQPRGGDAYHKDLAKMFAPIGKLGEHDESESRKKTQAEFYEAHKSDPYPDQINEMYGIKNPKIVISGEV